MPEIDARDALQLAIRFLHILSAIGTGGAILLQFFALHPVVSTLDDAARRAIAPRVADRWRPFAFTFMTLLLITGLVNFLMFQIPAYREHPAKAVYHGLFGAKLLLALVIFHSATVLLLPGEKGDRYRAAAGGRLSFMAVVLVLIIAIATYMRYFPQLHPMTVAPLAAG